MKLGTGRLGNRIGLVIWGRQIGSSQGRLELEAGTTAGDFAFFPSPHTHLVDVMRANDGIEKCIEVIE